MPLEKAKGATAARVAENVFRREGEFWSLAYAGRLVRLSDAKGLRDLARLLARQGATLHVVQLVGGERLTREAAERARAAVTMRIRSALRRIGKEHPALARHLARSVRTGKECRYDPEVPTRWLL